MSENIEMHVRLTVFNLGPIDQSTHKALSPFNNAEDLPLICLWDILNEHNFFEKAK